MAIPAPITADALFILEEMKSTMPSDLANSHYGHNILNAFVNELSSLEEAMKKVTERAFAYSSDSDGLTLWEELCGLPPNPDASNMTIAQRTQRLYAHLVGHYDYFGSDFVNNLAILANNTAPLVMNNSSLGKITLTFATALSSAQVNDIIRYCEDSGPAHLQWEVSSTTGSSNFYVGTDPATPPGTFPAGKVGVTRI